MDSVTYRGILQNNCLPFVKERFPEGYRLYQYNDNKHKSKSAVEWVTENRIIDHVMERPASSPDINAIENLWSTMKQYLEYTLKPKKKGEFVNDIKVFWEPLTVQQCSNYIDHVHIVLSQIVLNDGAPSGF